MPFTAVLHELRELLPEVIELVLPALLEFVTLEDVFELTDDELFEMMELLLPCPEVVALTDPEGEVMVLVAACEATT